MEVGLAKGLCDNCFPQFSDSPVDLPGMESLSVVWEAAWGCSTAIEYIVI